MARKEEAWTKAATEETSWRASQEWGKPDWKSRAENYEKLSRDAWRRHRQSGQRETSWSQWEASSSRSTGVGSVCDAEYEESSEEEAPSEGDTESGNRDNTQKQAQERDNGSFLAEYCDATGRQRGSLTRWFGKLTEVDRKTVDWKIYEQDPEEDEHVVAEAKCACCGQIRQETFTVARASMLYWNKAGPVPNPVTWCNPCVTQVRRAELQRLFEEEMQSPEQFRWAQSEHVKMDVRALKSTGMVHRAPVKEHAWAVDNCKHQRMRSEAKNLARVENVHGKEAAEDSEIAQNLELVGWTGKDILQKIQVIKSNGATAVMIKKNRTEVECLQAEFSAETDEKKLYIDLVQQGATKKELKEVSKAAMELKTAWTLNRTAAQCPVLLERLAGGYRKAVQNAKAQTEQREQFLEWLKSPDNATRAKKILRKPWRR